MNKKNGFLLIESLVAIIVFSISIVSIIGFQNSVLQLTADTYNRTIANSLAESITGQINIDKANIIKYINTDKTYVGYNNWEKLVTTSLPKANMNLPIISADIIPGGTKINITIFWMNPFDNVVSSYVTSTVIF